MVNIGDDVMTMRLMLRRWRWWACFALGLTLQTAGAAERCQILDNLYEPIYRINTGLMPSSRVQGHGKTTIMELDADWEMGFIRNVFRGEMDIHARIRNSLFIGSAEIGLPSQTTSLALDAGWTLRYGQGQALQVRAMPGLYGDLNALDSRGFYVPFSLALIQAFHPDLSGVAGLEVRPGFDRTLMPIVGLKWEPFNWLGIEPRLPRSRITWFATPEWSAYAAFEWRNLSYALSDARRMITLQDFRTYGGLAHRLSDRMELSLEVGRALGREVKFRRGERYDVASVVFARVGVGGPF